MTFSRRESSGIAYFDNGLATKETVVFLHGLGANASYGEFLTSAFPHTRILLPEFPGHGFSPAPVTAPDLYQIALQLLELFNTLGLEKPVICGHSMGGQVAMIMDLVKPGYFAAMHLISPAGLEEFTDAQKQVMMSGYQIGKLFQPMMVPVFQPEQIQELLQIPDADLLESYTRSMLDRPVTALLPQINTRALVYFGAADPFIPNRLFNAEMPLRFVHRVLDPYSNFTLVPVMGAGHWPMTESRSELIRLLKENQ